MGSRKDLLIKEKIQNSLFKGFSDVFASFGFLGKHKGTIKYYILPFLINIVVLSATFYFAYTWLSPWLESFLQGDSWFFKLIAWLIKPLLITVLAITTVFIYSIVGGIIISPFLDFLSEKVEVVEGGESFDEPFSLANMLGDIVRTLKNMIKLLLVLLLINLLLFIFNLIPGVAIIITFLNFLFASFFYGFQFFDYPLERRRYTFGDKFYICRKYFFSVAGNGMAFFLLSLIPVIGFLGFNSGTVGAALTFTRDIKPALANK